jgi:hypothetical protein
VGSPQLRHGRSGVLRSVVRKPNEIGPPTGGSVFSVVRLERRSVISAGKVYEGAAAG